MTTTTKRYRLMMHGTSDVTLALRSMTTEELRKAVRRDRHAGMWKLCERKLSDADVDRALAATAA